MLAWSTADDPSLYGLEFLRARAELECAAQLDFARSTRAVRDWFSDMSARPPLMGNVVTLTRIFAVIGAITLPLRSFGDVYLDYSKWSHPRLVLNPGGNLATLVWLAWRYIHGYAVEFDRVLAKVLAEEDLDTACNLLFDFVTAAGTVPAYDPALAADRSLSDQAVLLWPTEFSRPDFLVRSRVRRLQRAIDLGLGRTRRGVAAFPFSYLDAVPLPEGQPESDPEFFQLLTDRAFVLQRNYLGYAHAATMVFGAVLDLLLIVGHFTAVMRRYLCPYEPRIGLDEGPGPVPNVSGLRRFLPRFRTPLRYIRELPASLLDGHFVECASRVTVSPEYWLALEGDMVEWVNYVGPLAVCHRDVEEISRRRSASACANLRRDDLCHRCDFRFASLDFRARSVAGRKQVPCDQIELSLFEPVLDLDLLGHEPFPAGIAHQGV